MAARGTAFFCFRNCNWKKQPGLITLKHHSLYRRVQRAERCCRREFGRRLWIGKLDGRGLRKPSEGCRVKTQLLGAISILEDGGFGSEVEQFDLPNGTPDGEDKLPSRGGQDCLRLVEKKNGADQLQGFRVSWLRCPALRRQNRHKAGKDEKYGGFHWQEPPAARPPVASVVFLNQCQIALACSNVPAGTPGFV